MERAIEDCTNGIGIWQWASTEKGSERDVVMACAGDVPTLETPAAVDLLRQHFTDIKVRVVNVVDLMTIQPSTEHPHGLSDREFDSLFTIDKPVIFAYHGSGCRKRLSGRDRAVPAHLGGAGVSHTDPLQKARQRLALCGFGQALTLLRSDPHGLS